MAVYKYRGEPYPLAFTVSVVEKFCERFGSLAGYDALDKDADDATLMKERIWALREMMIAGAEIARVDGKSDLPDVPDLEEMYKMTEVREFKNVTEALNSCISGDTERTVEVEEDPKAKNAKAAQKE